MAQPQAQQQDSQECRGAGGRCMCTSGPHGNNRAATDTRAAAARDPAAGMAAEPVLAAAAAALPFTLGLTMEAPLTQACADAGSLVASSLTPPF